MAPEENPVTLLLVEDDSGHARLIERNLRRAGIENPLLHFDSGSKFTSFLFDDEVSRIATMSYLVLLDLNLPGTDGYEILHMIKNDPKRHRIPVVVLTTTSNPREIERCYELGCNMYITKPVDYDNFSAAMSKFAALLSIVKIPSH